MTLINATARYKLVHDKLEELPILIITNNHNRNNYFQLKIIIQREPIKSIFARCVANVKNICLKAPS